MKVTFENLSPDKSSLIIALYDKSENFTGTNVFHYQIIPVKDTVFTWKLKELTEGTYAISVYQDLNENEILDRNMFGKPREPYGFSNNPPVRFNPPAFYECSFFYDGKLDLVIKLR